MEWERTKTILIVAFVVLNAIFIVQLWLIPTYFDASLYTTRQEVEASLAELNHRNITVAAEVPRHLRRVRMMEYSLPLVDHQQVAAKILGPNAVHTATVNNPQPGYKLFREQAREVTVYNDGRVVYRDNAASGHSGTEKEAIATVESFLHATVGMPGDARVVAIEKEAGKWWIEYGQYWRRQALRSSYIISQVAGEAVLEMEYYWLKPIGFTGQRSVTIPATGALMVVADYLRSGTTITDIYLSWYNRPIEAESWQAPPVWVIVTDKDGNFYINAFTGEMELQQEFYSGR